MSTYKLSAVIASAMKRNRHQIICIQETERKLWTEIIYQATTPNLPISLSVVISNTDHFNGHFFGEHWLNEFVSRDQKKFRAPESHETREHS